MNRASKTCEQIQSTANARQRNSSKILYKEDIYTYGAAGAEPLVFSTVSAMSSMKRLPRFVN